MAASGLSCSTWVLRSSLWHSGSWTTMEASKWLLFLSTVQLLHTSVSFQVKRDFLNKALRWRMSHCVARHLSDWNSSIVSCELSLTSWNLPKAGILKWVAMLSSRGSSQPRDRTQVSHIVGESFTAWATRKQPIQPKHMYRTYFEPHWNMKCVEGYMGRYVIK